MTSVLESQRAAKPVLPCIMGILNVTPDSFSDGGEFSTVDTAVEHAMSLVSAGAGLIDVGGESTRPGAERVSAQEELRRVRPVIAELIDRGVAVSVDTMHASTALVAAELGAVMINDVSGGKADPAMARVAAETGLSFVVTHWNAAVKTAKAADSLDIVAAVRKDLSLRVAELIVTGVRQERIILDPGLGFAKTANHNWAILGQLPALIGLGFPVLIGASRKRFLGELLAADAPIEHRDAATATISAIAAERGVWGVRVHNVAETRAALTVWELMQPS